MFKYKCLSEEEENSIDNMKSMLTFLCRDQNVCFIINRSYRFELTGAFYEHISDRIATPNELLINFFSMSLASDTKAKLLTESARTKMPRIQHLIKSFHNIKFMKSL